MIKRYILHIEFRWGYRPHISIKKLPSPGDRIIDGGTPGTLVSCPTCSNAGLLHKADAQPGEHTWQDGCCVECEADTSWCDHPPQDLKPLS